MILKGIPFRVWEKVIRYGIAFFSITALISPFLALILYLFESDFDYLLSEKTNKELTVQADLVDDLNNRKNLLDHTLTPYIPLPEIEKSITFENFNNRPDVSEENKGYIALSSTKNSLLASKGEQVYLNCREFDSISFSKEKTPYSIIPKSISSDTLVLELNVCYEDGKGNMLLDTSREIVLKKRNQTTVKKLSKNSDKALKALGAAKLYLPDSLISLMGGKEYKKYNNAHRLFFSKNAAGPTQYIRTGDILTYSKGSWIHKKGKRTKAPLFIVKSISSAALEGTFWNENGFYEKEISLSFSPLTSSVHAFSFDKVYKRNNESIICKIEGRTFLLKPGDWLVKNNLSWHHVKNIAEFNNLMELKTLSELIIFGDIYSSKKSESFTAYVFDSTRSNYKKLEIPLKKKETLGYNK